MEPQGSLTNLQVPTTCPYPEPDQSSPCPTSHFLKIHINIIIPPTPESYRWSLSLRFLHQNPVCTSPLPHTCYMPRPFILLDLITRTILGDEYKPSSSSLFSFLHAPVASSLLGPNILLNTLFSNTISLRSSLNVSDQISNPYQTTGKIIVLHISIFVFLDSKLEDKKILHRMTPSIPWLQSALKFFLNRILVL